MFRMHLGTGMCPQCLPGPYPLPQEAHADLFACIFYSSAQPFLQIFMEGPTVCQRGT